MIAHKTARLCTASLLLSLLLLATGCAAPRANRGAPIPPRHSISEFSKQRFAEVNDPYERLNRNMYRFNFYFDKYVFLPVVSGYEFITPIFVQNRVSNFYDNISEIRNFTNCLFQAKGKQSLTVLGRFATNSTIGIGGLFDPATALGLSPYDEDFGQTLGYWGVGSGPYLVLPILGPSSHRDAGGLVVDAGIFYGVYSAIDPFDDSSHSFAISTALSTMNFVDMRHQQKFRYFRSGYPFEYYMVRFFYHEKRELDSLRQVPRPQNPPQPRTP